MQITHSRMNWCNKGQGQYKPHAKTMLRTVFLDFLGNYLQIWYTSLNSEMNWSMALRPSCSFLLSRSEIQDELLTVWSPKVWLNANHSQSLEIGNILIFFFHHLCWWMDETVVKAQGHCSLLLDFRTLFRIMWMIHLSDGRSDLVPLYILCMMDFYNLVSIWPWTLGWADYSLEVKGPSHCGLMLICFLIAETCGSTFLQHCIFKNDSALG